MGLRRATVGANRTRGTSVTTAFAGCVPPVLPAAALGGNTRSGVLSGGNLLPFPPISPGLSYGPLSPAFSLHSTGAAQYSYEGEWCLSVLPPLVGRTDSENPPFLQPRRRSDDKCPQIPHSNQHHQHGDHSTNIQPTPWSPLS